MKRTTAVLLATVLILAVSVQAQDFNLKGKMMASGYLGYALGMGDVFDEYESDYYKYSLDAGISFGGMFHYGIAEKFMIGGELMLQKYKAKAEYTGPSGYGFGDADDSETNTHILANCLYAMNYTDDNDAFFLTFGGGIYDDDFGLNGGIVYRKMVSPTIGIFAMPRIHLVMADDTFELIHLAVGVMIPIGSK